MIYRDEDSGLPARPKSDAPSEGLGDTVEKITKKLGIKTCGGCKRRKKKLNKLFPYKKKDKK